MLLINIGAFQLCWLASLLAFLASKQQPFLAKPLPKSVAWSGFSVMVIVGSVLLTQIHHWLAASTIVVVAVMTNWLVLALASPYLNNKKAVLASVSLLFLAISLLGGGHVA